MRTCLENVQRSTGANIIAEKILEFSRQMVNQPSQEKLINSPNQYIYSMHKYVFCGVVCKRKIINSHMSK